MKLLTSLLFLATLIAASPVSSRSKGALIEVTMLAGNSMFQLVEVGDFPSGVNSTSIITGDAVSVKVAHWFPAKSQNERWCGASLNGDRHVTFQKDPVNLVDDGKPGRIKLFNCVERRVEKDEQPRNGRKWMMGF